jgi:putative ABC transport system permease protein
MALRNIIKNFRRSLFTIVAIGAGFSAISIFSGYIHNTYIGLSEQAVRGEGLGHLTIVKEGYFENGSLNPQKYLITGAELRKIAEVLAADPDVELWTPRLSVSGLITNGRTSTIFIGEGIVPDDEVRLKGNFRADRAGKLNAQAPTAVAVSSDLGRMLGFKTGGTAVLFTTTFEGQANALDADVGSLYNTGITATNDKSLLLPLDFARRLLDTDGTDRIRVLLHRIEDSDKERDRLAGKLSAIGLRLEVHTWKDLSNFYKQVKGLFDMIFVFIFSIVFIIVIMSVTNTMSMTVVERTREIGTLRALGMKRRQIAKLFSVEAMTLAVIGSLVGLLVTIVVALGVNAASLSYTPPNTSDTVPLLVDLVYGRMSAAFLGLLLLVVVASYIPASGAARMRIVDALGHV